MCYHSFCCLYVVPSSRRHLSCDACLEDEREGYPNCSVLYCNAVGFWHLFLNLAQFAGVRLVFASSYIFGFYLHHKLAEVLLSSPFVCLFRRITEKVTDRFL